MKNMMTSRRSCCTDPYVRCCPRTLVLYYRLSISDNDPTDNASRTNFVTDPTAPGIYRGISNRYMNEEDYIEYNKNILTYVGFRTPKSTTLPTNLQVPDIYNETLNITVPPYEQNFVQAVNNYLDPGSGIETLLPTTTFKITAASGIFKEYTKIKIEYFNGETLADAKRRMTFY